MPLVKHLLLAFVNIYMDRWLFPTMSDNVLWEEHPAFPLCLEVNIEISNSQHGVRSSSVDGCIRGILWVLSFPPRYGRSWSIAIRCRHREKRR